MINNNSQEVVLEGGNKFGVDSIASPGGETIYIVSFSQDQNDLPYYTSFTFEACDMQAFNILLNSMIIREFDRDAARVGPRMRLECTRSVKYGTYTLKFIGDVYSSMVTVGDNYQVFAVTVSFNDLLLIGDMVSNILEGNEQ